MFRVLMVLICCLSAQLIGRETKVIIGIAGGTGSGKTTLAQKILEAFPENSILISQDSYYRDLSHLSMGEREKQNFDHPNALDFEMLCDHLIALKNNQTIEQPIYNFHTHSRDKGTKVIAPAELIIVEGILLFAVEEVRNLCDLKIYVDTPDDVRFLRRLERDINERSRELSQVCDQYLSTVKPMHDAFVQPSKQYADIIIPHGGLNQIGLSVLLAKLNEDIHGISVQYPRSVNAEIAMK